MSPDCRLKGKWIHELEGQSFTILSPAGTTMPSLLTLSVSPVVPPPVPAARVPFGPAAFCLLRRMLRLWKKEKSIKGGLRFWEMPILQSIILMTNLIGLIRTFLK